MAIGNLIGSNIFNILLIIGIAATIHPINLEVDLLLIDAFIFLIASSLCIIFTKIKKKYEFSRPEGITLLAIYITYLIFVIIRG